MIIDSFIFFNEYEILEGRLEYPYPHVDYFVLVESNMTFSGKPKPMYYMQNMSRFKPYLDKILYFPYITKAERYDYSKLPTHDRDYETGPWAAEHAQRRHMAACIDLFKDEDIIMFSDVDEIPHKDCIPIIQHSLNNGIHALTIEQDHFSYNFRQKQVIPIRGTTVSKISFAKQRDPQEQRNEKYGYQFIARGGWHLSYWGDTEKIKYKIESFSHMELDRDEFKNPEHIKERIRLGKDLFNRENPYVSVDPSEIPEDVMRIFGKYNDYLIKANV